MTSKKYQGFLAVESPDWGGEGVRIITEADTVGVEPMPTVLVTWVRKTKKELCTLLGIKAHEHATAASGKRCHPRKKRSRATIGSTSSTQTTFQNERK